MRTSIMLWRGAASTQTARMPQPKIRKVAALAMAFVFGVTGTVLHPGASLAAGMCFQPPVKYASGYNPMSLFSVDLNMNGFPDLSVINNFNSSSYYGFSLLWNTGEGKFPTRAEGSAGSQPYSVAYGDFDNDGCLDLAVANVYSANISVMKGNCKGGFESPKNFAVGQHPHDLVASDLNKDGWVDIAVANGFSDNCTILLNNKDTGIAFSTTTYPAGDGSHNLVAADLNGDGYDDLAIANYNTNFVTILLNNGDGTFAASPDYVVGTAPYSVVARDLDGDGDSDLAIAMVQGGIPGSVAIGMNYGNGSFATPVSYPVLVDPMSVVTADLDMDNDPDLAVANGGSDSISVLVNNGSGAFPSTIHVPVGYRQGDIVASDLDRDGDDDLAVTCPSTDSVLVLASCVSTCEPVIVLDRGADLNCDGIAGDVFDVIAAIDIAFGGGVIPPCAVTDRGMPTRFTGGYSAPPR